MTLCWNTRRSNRSPIWHREGGGISDPPCLLLKTYDLYCDSVGAFILCPPPLSMRLIEDKMDQPQVRVQELAPSRQRAFKPIRQASLARETLPVTSTANAGGMA